METAGRDRSVEENLLHNTGPINEDEFAVGDRLDGQMSATPPRAIFDLPYKQNHRASHIVDQNSEAPGDLRAFFGHPLNQTSNGDAIALLHEYYNLPAIGSDLDKHEQDLEKYGLARYGNDYFSDVSDDNLADSREDGTDLESGLLRLENALSPSARLLCSVNPDSPEVDTFLTKISSGPVETQGDSPAAFRDSIGGSHSPLRFIEYSRFGAEYLNSSSECISQGSDYIASAHESTLDLNSSINSELIHTNPQIPTDSTGRTIPSRCPSVDSSKSDKNSPENLSTRNSFDENHNTNTSDSNLPSIDALRNNLTFINEAAVTAQSGQSSDDTLWTRSTEATEDVYQSLSHRVDMHNIDSTESSERSAGSLYDSNYLAENPSNDSFNPELWYSEVGLGDPSIVSQTPQTSATGSAVDGSVYFVMGGFSSSGVDFSDQFQNSSGVCRIAQELPALDYLAGYYNAPNNLSFVTVPSDELNPGLDLSHDLSSFTNTVAASMVNVPSSCVVNLSANSMVNASENSFSSLPGGLIANSSAHSVYYSNYTDSSWMSFINGATTDTGAFSSVPYPGSNSLPSSMDDPVLATLPLHSTNLQDGNDSSSQSQMSLASRKSKSGRCSVGVAPPGDNMSPHLVIDEPIPTKRRRTGRTTSGDQTQNSRRNRKSKNTGDVCQTNPPATNLNVTNVLPSAYLNVTNVLPSASQLANATDVNTISSGNSVSQNLDAPVNTLNVNQSLFPNGTAQNYSIPLSFLNASEIQADITAKNAAILNIWRQIQAQKAAANAAAEATQNIASPFIMKPQIPVSTLDLPSSGFNQFLGTDLAFTQPVASAGISSLPYSCAPPACNTSLFSQQPLLPQASFDSNMLSMHQASIGASNVPQTGMPQLPFPLPAVPPGYRLVITHRPLPTSDQQSLPPVTQLIIDHPSYAPVSSAAGPTHSVDASVASSCIPNDSSAINYPSIISAPTSYYSNSSFEKSCPSIATSQSYPYNVSAGTGYLPNSFMVSQSYPSILSATGGCIPNGSAVMQNLAGTHSASNHYIPAAANSLTAVSPAMSTTSYITTTSAGTQHSLAVQSVPGYSNPTVRHLVANSALFVPTAPGFNSFPPGASRPPPALLNISTAGAALAPPAQIIQLSSSTADTSVPDFPATYTIADTTASTAYTAAAAAVAAAVAANIASTAYTDAAAAATAAASTACTDAAAAAAAAATGTATASAVLSYPGIPLTQNTSITSVVPSQPAPLDFTTIAPPEVLPTTVLPGNSVNLSQTIPATGGIEPASDTGATDLSIASSTAADLNYLNLSIPQSSATVTTQPASTDHISSHSIRQTSSPAQNGKSSTQYSLPQVNLPSSSDCSLNNKFKNTFTERVDNPPLVHQPVPVSESCSSSLGQGHSGTAVTCGASSFQQLDTQGLSHNIIDASDQTQSSCESGTSCTEYSQVTVPQSLYESNQPVTKLCPSKVTVKRSLSRDSTSTAVRPTTLELSAIITPKVEDHATPDNLGVCEGSGVQIKNEAESPSNYESELNKANNIERDKHNTFVEVNSETTDTTGAGVNHSCPHKEDILEKSMKEAKLIESEALPTNASIGASPDVSTSKNIGHDYRLLVPSQSIAQPHPIYGSTGSTISPGMVQQSPCQIPILVSPMMDGMARAPTDVPSLQMKQDNCATGYNLSSASSTASDSYMWLRDQDQISPSTARWPKSFSSPDDSSQASGTEFVTTPSSVCTRKLSHRRLSSNGLKKSTGARTRASMPRASHVTFVPKIEPDLSGFQFYLDTPISTTPRIDEDRLTYLNKGQYYSLVLNYKPDETGSPVQHRGPIKSVVMVMFRGRQTPAEELKTWEFWHSRQHSYKQRVLDIDSKITQGNMPISIEEIAFNAVSVWWEPRDSPVTLNLAINCLSTDFSHQKGVKGNPLHIQIDTYEEESLLQPSHRAYSQIKVFCDKGADRKAREEERKRTRGSDIEIVDDSQRHEPCDRSNFYTMLDRASLPVLYTPPEGIVAKMPIVQHDSLGYTAHLHGRQLSQSESDRISMNRIRGFNDPLKQKTLLYVREELDTVFTALVLEEPTLACLTKKIQDKYNIPSESVINVFNQSAVCLIKVDDNVVSHFANESTFIIDVCKSAVSSPDSGSPGSPSTDGPVPAYSVTLTDPAVHSSSSSSDNNLNL